MATGLEVAEVFRRHGETYRQVHAEHLGRTERRVMGAIAACRTAALGGHAEFCKDCGCGALAPTTPAATGIAQSARGSRGPSGSPTGKPNCFRCRISTSSSPYRPQIAADRIPE